LIRVLVTQVRPDKVHDYLDLQKNAILPAVQKSGAKFYNFARETLRRAHSGIRLCRNWADLDDTIGAEKGLGKDGYQALLSQVRALIVQSEYIIYRYEPDLSYLPAAHTTTRREIGAAKSVPKAESQELKAELGVPFSVGHSCAKIKLCTRNPTSACSSSVWAQWAIFFMRCLRLRLCASLIPIGKSAGSSSRAGNRC
jgi:hypothetical protein